VANGIALLLLMLLVGGCGAVGTMPDTRLDPQTGATITRAAVPTRFFRDNSGRAAYARDFVYLGPLSVNRMGSYRYYLWLSAWSTHAGAIDTTQRHDELETVTIFADGEPLSLEAAGWTLSTIGASVPVYERPVASAIDAYYPVTLDQIRLLSEAIDISIQTTPGESGRYEVWAGSARGTAAMQQFVRQTP